MAWIAEASPRELIRDAVLFAVDMPNGPGTASKNKGFPQIVAFLTEDTKVVAVATPIAQHEHHD